MTVFRGDIEMKTRIVEYKEKDGTVTLVIELSRGNVDWPIRYHNGQLAFDYPEQVPKSIKKELYKRFDNALSKGKRYHNDYMEEI